MNDRGPRRFSKYMDGVSVKDFLLTLTQEKFEGINQRFADLKESIIEARRGMENRMAGFPSEFAQKNDLLAAVSMLKDLKEEMNNLKNERANLHGRILATGGVMVLVIALVQVVTQVLIHIYMGRG